MEKVIINPVEFIKDKIPELENVKGYGNEITIPYSAWDTRLERIEDRNIRKYGRSLTKSGLESYFNPCIVSTNPFDKVITFNEEKYKLIRKFLTASEFNSRCSKQGNKK